jgi:hypothetical protein
MILMAQNQPIDDDLNPGSYGFGDKAPARREGPPIRIGKYDHSEPEEDEIKRKRRRSKQQRDEEDLEEAEAEGQYYKNDDPFKSKNAVKDPFEVLDTPKPWWFWPVILMAVGATGFLIAAVLAGFRLDPKVGVLVFVACLIGVLVQTVAVTFLLFFIGQIFGIDYGPVKEAFVKMIASVSFINGFTLMSGMLLVSGFGPLGGLMAFSMITMLMYMVFSKLFQLTMFETMITIFAIEFCAWAMGAGLGFVLLRHMMLKA